MKAWSETPFSYSEIGAVGRGEHPAGYENFSYRAVLGGPDHFSTAADDLFSWRMHERSGIRVTASAPRAAPGVVLVQRLQVGPISIVAPVRVLDVTDEKNRAGLAYGTLRSHPEQGEEQFLIERQTSGTVTLTISGFVRPAVWYARLGAPATHYVQRLITRRYLRALRSPVSND